MVMTVNTRMTKKKKKMTIPESRIQGRKENLFHILNTSLLRIEHRLAKIQLMSMMTTITMTKMNTWMIEERVEGMLRNTTMTMNTRIVVPVAVAGEGKPRASPAPNGRLSI